MERMAISWYFDPGNLTIATLCDDSSFDKWKNCMISELDMPDLKTRILGKKGSIDAVLVDVERFSLQEAPFLGRFQRY